MIWLCLFLVVVALVVVGSLWLGCKKIREAGERIEREEIYRDRPR